MAVQGSEVKKVIVACEAGMGSSVLLTSQLQKRLKDLGITVEHSPVSQIPDDADVVVVHEGMADRARKGAGDTPVLPFKVYMGDPTFDELEESLRNDETIEGS